MKLKQNFLLVFIIALAVFLRFYKLSDIPIGFNDDEAAFGYNAYSILKTQKDEWGRFLPFPAFESFGDWKLVNYLYLTVISVSIFDLNEFAARAPSALFGTFSVFATYLLTKKLFSKNTALIAAFLLAISPWHIVASRNAFESDLLVFFITLAVYLFIKGLQNRRLLTFSLIVFGLTFYTYRSSWTFIPIFIFVLFYLHFEKIRKTKFSFKKNIILILLIIAPLIPTVLTFQGQSRFLQESFISGVARTGIDNDVNLKQGVCKEKFPQTFCKLVHNKYLEFSQVYLNNYLGNLSYKTYFEKANFTGFQSFATRSVFYTFELPLLILGFIFLFKNHHLSVKVLLPWILIAPIGASIAGVGNYGRINLIMPAPQIISAFGLISLIKIIKSYKAKLLASLALSAIIAVYFFGFLQELFFIEPKVTSRYQRYGYKQLFSKLNQIENSYEHIYISKKIDSGHQYMQYLFWTKTDPAYFAQNAIRPKGEDGWIQFDSVGKYKFIPSVPNIENIPDKTLLVAGENEIDYQITPAFTINDLNGDNIFKVYETDQIKDQQ